MSGGGDTPEETLRFKNKDRTGVYTIAKYSTSSKKLLLAAGNSGGMYVIADPGKIVSDHGPRVETFAPTFKSLVEAAGYEVKSTGTWLLDMEIGADIQNWDSYISV